MRRLMNCTSGVSSLLAVGTMTGDCIREVPIDETSLRILREFRAPGGDSDRQFGYSVAIDGDLVCVANDQGEADALGSGRIHLLRLDRNDISKEIVLRAPDRKWPDRFGSAMCLQQGRLLAGAPMDAENGWDAGAVWLFEEVDSDWRLSARLQPEESEEGAWFGAAVDLDDDLAVIGSPRTDGTGLDCGSVQLFRKLRDRWVVESVLTAPDQASGDFFGSSVACHDQWIAIGAWGDDDHGEKTGAVWLFAREGTSWSAVQKIVPPEAEARDRFGWRVDFMGGRLVVSACGVDESRGRVYVHDFNGQAWVQTARLEDPRGKSGDWFGFSLSTRGNLLVVGSPGASTHAKWSGRISVYRDEGTAWERLGAVSSESDLGEQPIQFGWAVATDGQRVVAGRIDDADGPPVAGRAWLLGVPGVPLPTASHQHPIGTIGTAAESVRDW